MRSPVAVVVALGLATAAGCQSSGTQAPLPAATGTAHSATTTAAAPALALTPVVLPAVRTYNRPPYTAAFSEPHRDAQYPDQGTTSLDALHYGLALTWTRRTRTLSGSATIRFRATRSERHVSLDFGAALRVTSVRLDGRGIPAAHPGQKLKLDTGPMTANTRHTLVVRYHGQPRSYTAHGSLSTLSGAGWNVEPDGQVWTLEEPFGAFTWYPVDDQPSDKAFYDITWHTQPSWTAVSNGQLTEDLVRHGQRTTHWELDSPAASYLITAEIGPYGKYRQTGPHSLPLTYWVPNADRSVLPVLRRTPAMLSWLEARLGRYPFDSLGVVVVPARSAVETQTMVTVGTPILQSSAAPSDLVHEYVHSWYGDEVTPTDWLDLWLNESFAYYVQLTWEASHGVTMTAAWRAALNRDDQMLRTTYGPPGAPHPDEFAALNVYECGARMLDRLHRMLGPARFAALLRGWPRLRRFGNVDRAEWISYLNRTSGMNLGRFVHRWLMSTTSPR